MDNPKDIEVQFTITLKDANLILKALGKLPFEEVYELIGKLNVQANKQLEQNAKNSNNPTN